jgi:FkbM family methyltransferase
MSQSIRDFVRLRLPRALTVYQRHVAPRLGADRRLLELSQWAARGADLVERTGMHGIRFERDGVWIDDGAGWLWAYEPGPLSSTLGAEFGLRYEQAEIDVLAARLPVGGTLVDVGANVGLHAVQLARRVQRLQVLAFEPVGDTFAMLERNIAKNGVPEQVQARRVAVSDKRGTLRLTKRFQYGNFVVPDDAAVAADAFEEVLCLTLDELVEESSDRVDAIKCDVEGAELGVLRGATRTLERYRPMLLLEVDERWARRYGNTGADVFAFLSAREYAYECFVDGRVLPRSSVEEDLRRASNFLFTAA